MKNDYLVKNIWKAIRIPFLVTFLILMLGFFQFGQSQVVTGSSVCEGSTLVVGLAPAKSNASFGLYRTADGGSTYTKIEETYAPSFNYTFTPQTVVGLYKVYSFPGFPPLPDDPSTGTYIGALSVWANPVPVISGETNPCFKYSETYTTDGGMSNYGWSVSNGSIVSGGGSGDDFAEISWNGTPGAASVSVAFTDGNGCTSASATIYNVDVKYPVYIGSAGYSTLQAAINAASTNDIIDMVCDHSEGFVAVNKVVTIDGNGNTLASSSATYGLAIQSTGVTIQNITVDGAGTFGIHQQPNSGDLWIENATVQNGGGSGFAMNCSSGITLKDIISTGNLGNGVSITNCQNVTINGVTTSGNAFGGGFSAGIGIFSNSATCSPDGTSGVTLTGIVNTTEPVQVYEQATTGTIANVTLPSSFTHYLGFNKDKYYYESLNAALAAADFTLQTYPVLQPYVYVKEVSTGNLFVEALTSMNMSIQAAINSADQGKAVFVGDGTFTENVIISKEGLIVTNSSSPVIDGGMYGIVVTITANNVTLTGFTIQNSGSGANNAGIFLQNVTGCSIKKNLIQNNSNGIVVGLGSGNEIYDNDINSNTGFGIALAGSSGNNIELNVLNGNGTVAEIALDNAGLLGFPTILSTENSILENVLSNIANDGIYFGQNCGNNTVNKNSVNGAASIGIHMWRDVSNQEMRENTIINSHVGIKLRGSSNNDIVDNTITGNGVGIVAEAYYLNGVWYPCANNNISNNIISDNTTYGLQANDANQTTTIDATNNWWGSPSGPYNDPYNTCGSGNEIVGNVSFLPWCADATCSATVSSLPVTNVTNSPNTYYCSIQDAIDDAAAGDVIEVTAGAYEEILAIDKAITLNGPNKNKTGSASDRVAEAIIQYPAGLADGNYYLATIDAGEVIIKGFTFNDNVSGGFIYNGTWPLPMLAGGVRSNESNTLVENNRFIGFNNIAVLMTQSDAFNQTVAKVNNTTRYNYFEGGAVYHAVYYQASAGIIEHNHLVNVSAGVQIQPYFTNAAGTVTNNEISMYSSGLYYNYANWTIDGNALWSFTGNTITTPSAAPVWNKLTWNALPRSFEGIRVETYLQNNPASPKIYEPKATFTNNTIDGGGATTAGGWLAINGAYFRNVKGDGATNIANLTFSNNTFSNVEVGVQFDDQGTDVKYELSALYVNGNSYPTGMGIIEPYQIAFCGGGLVNNITRGTSFCSIQAAVDAASTIAGDVIQIEEAEYTEPGQVVISKNLTLQGTGKTTTTLRPGINTGSTGDTRGFILVQNGIDFTLKDMTIDCSTKLVWQAVRNTGSGRVENVRFTEIKYNPSTNYAGTAIAVFGNGNVDVENCDFDEIGRIGVHYFGSGVTNSTYSGNTYTGKGNGNWIDYALDIGAGAKVSAINNTISGNTGVASSDGSTSAGILASTYFGAGTEATIENNFIFDNTTGIYAGFDASDASLVIANNNSINGNDYGLISSNAAVNATCNWWGVTNGNTIATKIIGNVDYAPWLVNGTDSSTDPGFQPVLGSCAGTVVVIDLVETSPDNCDGPAGTIEVAFSGGTAPFDITWTGGSDNDINSPYTISGLPAGDYDIVITDANGSTATELAVNIDFLPVKNATTNHYYGSITEAVMAASNGHTLELCAGDYTETVSINKDLTIIGPNVGIDPNTGSRIDEAVLLDGKFNIMGANTVEIDGIKIYQTNITTPVSLGGSTVATIQNTIIERVGIAAGSTVRGIETSAGAGVKNIRNNLFTGDVSGGLFSGHKTWNSGMYINSAGSTVNIEDNVFENCRTALNLDDYNANIVLEGNTFDNCGTFLSFGGVSPTTGSHTLGSNNFKTPGSAFINLSNAATSFRLDITSSKYDGTLFSALDLTTLFNVEAGMYHRTRSGRNGLVYYVANNLYVRSDLNNDINTAVGYAAPGDVINLMDGTFNQRVVLNKSLTLEGQSETGSILDGSTGLTGFGSGIYLNNGVTNVTIKDLTVKNYAGNGPNSFAGIYAMGGNNALTVERVTLQDNKGGSGFYANGPITDVTLDYVTASGHDNSKGAARGIVIWNGLKSNITITNCTVFNNNCCGIELQDGDATGVLMQNNNIYNNGDNGIGIVGLTGPGENLIEGNTLQNNGRFGIEIKNPNGTGLDTGDGSIVVENNNVSLTSAISDPRDLAGIAVFRRGVLPYTNNVDIPEGVIVRDNIVSGYIQASNSDGFGIVIEGFNHTVTGNTLSGNDVGTQQQAGHLPYPGDGDQSNLADDYFGRGNSPYSCGNTITGNIYSSNGVDHRDVPGSLATIGTVVNNTTGKVYCSIQAAIDEASDDDVILVNAGTYAEDLNLYKKLDIRGPNYGISPNGGSRVSEAVLMPATSDPDPYSATAATMLYLSQGATGSSIRGLTFNGDNPFLTSGVVMDGADVDACEAIAAYEGIGNIRISENFFMNINYAAIDLYNYYNGGSATSGNVVSDNNFDNIQPSQFGIAVLIYNNCYTSIFDNIMTRVRIGIQTGNFYHPDPGNSTTISNNNIQTNRRGIFHNLAYSNASGFTLSNNVITASSTGLGADWDGILLSSLSVPSYSINNTISGPGSAGNSQGYEIWNVKNTYPANITGGTVSNVDVGLFANNFEGYNSNGTNGAHAIISALTITTKADGIGVYVLDSPQYTGTTPANIDVTVTDDCSISGAANGILAEGTNATVTVADNLATITGNKVGIRVKHGANLASVTGNTITDNADGGIIIESTAGTIGLINDNTISNNGYNHDPVFGLGLRNDKTTVVSATNNWWGTASGPYHSVYNTCGTGNAVAGQVDISPWLDAPGGTPEVLPVENVTNGTFYCTIQDAIDDVATTDSDVIRINAADYTEPGQILVTKSLTVTGLGKNSTILRSNINTGTGHPNDASAWILTSPETDVTIKDMTIDGNGKSIWTAVRFKDDGLVDNVAFNDIKMSSYYGIAVQVLNGEVDVANCEFTQIGRIGVHYRNGVISGAEISGSFTNNTYTGKGNGNWLDYAVDISGGTTVNLSNNYVSGNTGVATADGSTSAGLLVTSYFPLPVNSVANNVTITGNTLTGNTTGLAVGYNATDVSIVVASNNKIFGNDWGVSSTGPIVDATSNWWGSNNGPTYAGNPCGTGDVVSDSVMYDPWSNSDLFEFDIYQLEEFTLTGTTSVCIGGDTDITLSGSQNGGTNFDYEYYLYEGEDLVPGSVKIGDGDEITWTVTPSANSLYTVKAVNNLNLCELNMNGEAKVYVGPVTTIATITGACEGSNVEVPVTVTSFEEVGTFSLTLNFNPSVLTYQGFAGNPLLPGLQVNNSGSGVLKISWFTGGTPVSLNDGETIVTLTFTYLGGGASNLAWDDSSPEFCEYGSGAPDYVVFCDTPTEDYYINGEVTGYDRPEVIAVSMLSSDDNEVTWNAVNGDLGYGYDLCIDPMIPFYHLDIDDLTSTATFDHLEFVQNAFYLNTTGLPTGFYDYWDSKGVNAGASGWQAVMWQIIIGNEPMFYISYDLGLDDYRLIDGLQYQVGAGEQTLRVSGDYPQGIYIFTGTVTDEHGCESLPFNVQMTFNTIPYVTAVSLQSTEDEIIWDPVNGDLNNGYGLCIDPAIPYYYFDIVALTSTEVLQSTAFEQNAFYLDGIYPPSFFDYWAAKGVVSGSGSWQGVMWDIINGNAPMFYVKFDGSDYTLIDGLQYQFASVEEPLRVSGDYPADTYTFTGSVTAFNGCPTSPFSMAMSLNTTPFLVFAFNGVQVAPGFTTEYCYNVPVEVTLDEIWSGVAPFDVYYTVTKDGSPFLTDNATVSNPNDVLFSSLLDPGIYVINVTSLTDGNGCLASASTLALYNATVTINEEPEVDIVINNIVATYGYNVAYCFNEAITAELGNIVSGSGPVDITWDVYVDGGLTPDPTLSGSATGVITGFEFFSGLLPYGTYELQLTSLIDANGCEPSNIGAYAATIVVNQEPEVHIEINNIVATYGYSVEYCYSETITAKLGTIVSGTGPVDVAWEVFIDGSVTPDPLLSGSAMGVTTGFEFFSGNLAAGVYELQLTSLVDAIGCEPSNIGAYAAIITINEEPALGFSFDGELAATSSTFYYSCYDEVVTVTLSHIWAGTAPFDIAWTVNGNPASATGVVLNDVLFSGAQGAGTYVVQITSIVDANGCSPADYAPYTATAVIPVILNADVASTNVTWFGADDGTITITNPSGGYGTYEYSIDGGISWQSSGNFTDLAPGIYNVQIRDEANTGCVIVLNAALEITEPAAISISGYFNYYNTAFTVMNNVKVDLVQGTSIILTTTTDNNGYYWFGNVQPGTYEVHASTGKPVGGINVTDAAQVNAWGVTPYEIELTRFYAGDVVLSNHLAANDAGLIQSYFMGGGLPWAGRPNWTFWKSGETIAVNPAPVSSMVYPAISVPFGSTPITQNFYGLVTGDFNMSFVPGSGKVESESLTLNYGNTIQVLADTEFELPLFSAMDMEVGAISLILNYPSDKVDVLGAYLTNDPDSPLWFTLFENELRIGWYSFSALHLFDGDALLTLQLRINSEAENGEAIYFSLAADPLNELADGSFNVIENAVLTIDVIEAMSTGINHALIHSDMSLVNNPNPFMGSTTFSYTLPADGKVTLEVYSSTGEKVVKLIDEFQATGAYSLMFNDNTLKPGVYAARLTLQTDRKVLVRTVTMIRHQ
jgi:parallel beta-helix repeat protein